MLNIANHQEIKSKPQGDVTSHLSEWLSSKTTQTTNADKDVEKREPQVALVVKSPTVRAGDIRSAGSIPGSGRSPGGGYGTPLQYSCLENPMDRGAWQAAVHGVVKSRTRLRD